MTGCLRTRVRKQPIIALYFESETVLKFYNLEASVVIGALRVTVAILSVSDGGSEDLTHAGNGLVFVSQV